jgi:SAM-dependent methyltransferase
MAHNDLVREQFRLQAPTWSGTGFAVRGLDWIVAELAPAPGDRVLDVAAGAAHLGRALAPRVAHVSALDLTPEMLAQGRRLAEEEALTNVAFVLGDAVALPWPDARFDLTVTRLSLHQVADPAAVVREMVRVTRPGGRVAVVDLTIDDDPVVAAEANRIERLRDPSHNRTMTIREIAALLESAGAGVRTVSSHDNPVPVEDWMERTATAPEVREEIRARFGEELAGGAPTGLRPRRVDAALALTHTWTMTVAVPATPPVGQR